MFIEMCKCGRVTISSEHVFVFVVSHCEIIFLSGQHRLSYRPGLLICILWTRRIFQGSGSYVLGGYVWCY